MNPALILIITFFVLMFLKVPIAYSLLLSAVATLLSMNGINGIPMTLIASSTYAAIAKQSLLAIPFFVLSGNIMVVGGIAKRLVDFFYAIVGKIAGGLAHAATLACMFFAALSGSSAATCASIGKAMIPEMEAHGYDRAFSAAVIATGGILGMIIPPSIAMIVYAQVAEVSVTKMFTGGVVPGILGGLVIMIYAYFFAKKKHYKTSKDDVEKISLWATFKDAFWALTFPLVILGSIYGGICTATEASAISVLYGLFVSFIYREISWKSFKHAVVDAVYDTATILLIMATSGLLGWLLTVLQIPQAMTTFMMSISNNSHVILLLILVLYLIIGCFIGTSPAIVLVVPILLPVVRALNIDLVFFGVFTVFSLGIGLITPPVGTDLFVISGISKLKIEAVIKAVIPFIILYTLLCVLFIFCPAIITALPGIVSV
ncbi:TRAP transporter large permease [Dysosmobacter sp.]|uniref:TRAP transporter large permease n=1 Tax=Dysosmobacter sp. TaxID=2591382 RepID=UPI002A86E680|nr:TRAP transporter large permease [Dysosmobacter sp.]MDY3282470.1 TRAP transporter large permease [Dysosmobacter sp.]